MNDFKGILMGMGNPLLDISANVPQSILDKYEVQLDSAILASEKHLPLYKELTTYYDVKYIAGGSTQNSIRIAQWMLQSCNKPKYTSFMGSVGEDENSHLLESCATQDGVHVHYMKDTAPTGTCAVLIKDNERSLVANLAAANNFKLDHLLTKESKNIYEKADYYYIAGFFLTVSVESFTHIGEHAVAANKVLCLNLSAPFIIEYFGEKLKIAMEYADYVFCNESEAQTYAKVHQLGDNLREVALKIAESPKKNRNRDRTVIFTQGSGNTIVAYKDVVTEYPVLPLKKELLVDTNGAGDAFVGGYLAMLVQDKVMEECVNAGHWAAQYIIQKSGTTIDEKCLYKVV